MRNAEEFSGQRSGLRRVRPAYRRPGPSAAGRPGASRIRYAHGGALPRVEPLCTVSTGPGAGHHGSEAGPGSGYVTDFAGGGYGGRLGGEAWLAEFPAGGRRADLWVLVGGGVAAAAAFAAAFVAAGGVASHPAAPGAAVPAVVSQACPAPAAGPTP
jgi:hypothetical protein